MIHDVETLATIVVDQAFRLHRDVGPGLLEHVYESVLADRLKNSGLCVDVQKPVAIIIDGKQYTSAFRADLLINNALLLELKSVEMISSVHIKQTLTYIRLLHLTLGLLINFGAASFKTGIKRIMNDAARNG